MIKRLYINNVAVRCLITSLLLATLVIGSLPTLALSSSQREIFNKSISYFNECVSTGGGLAIGNNKDYKGNQILSDEQMAKVKEYQHYYQEAVSGTDVPWQMLAVIHIRESGQMFGGPNNGQGPFQDLVGGWPVGEYDEATFMRAARRAVEEIKSKAGGRDLSEQDTIKYVFFAYNGLAGVYKRQALNLGFTQAQADVGEGSPYVMNRADKKRDPTDPETASNNTWGQIKVDFGGIEYPANKDYGAYVMFAGLGGAGASEASAKAQDNGHYIWTGDSRTVGMRNAVTSGNNDWAAEDSKNYDWFNGTAVGRVASMIKDGESTIIFNFGVNDINSVDKYIKRLNEIATNEWSKAKRIIVMSVNPVNDEEAKSSGYHITSKDIEEFNEKMKNELSSDIEFLDTYSRIKNTFKTTGDGLHYQTDTYKELYDIVRGTGVDTTAACTSDTTTGSVNEKIAQIAREWGEWGDTYQTCYNFGGGHGSQEDIDRRIEHHFSGGVSEYGIDCSGFASAVIYKATGKWQPWSTFTMCADTKNFKVVTEAQPGDLAINCSMHVEVIVNVNDDGTYDTVGSAGTGAPWGDQAANGCGGVGPNKHHYQGTKVLRYIGGGV